MYVCPEDRDVRRFLRSDLSPPAVKWRMTQVPFGASSRHFLLSASIRHHLALCRERYPETVALLEKAFYVDDLFVGLPIGDKGATVYSETRKILSDASVELRKWACSSYAFRKRFLCDKVAIEDEAGESSVIKVLGIPGEREGDQIILTIREASEFAWCINARCFRH